MIERIIRLPPSIDVENLIRYSKLPKVVAKSLSNEHPAFKKLLRIIRNTAEFATVYVWICEMIKHSPNSVIEIDAIEVRKTLLPNSLRPFIYKKLTPFVKFGLFERVPPDAWLCKFRNKINIANADLLLEAQKRITI